jgi:ubiquinol-cytochrome c reductase cytochrome b subunit
MSEQRPATGSKASAPSRAKALALWLDERLHISKLFESTAGHTVPASSGSWFYVFGSGTLLCFIVQIVTGICLSLVFAPTASEAWTSLIYLNYEQYLGWYLRAVHNGAPTSWWRSDVAHDPRCSCSAPSKHP